MARIVALAPRNVLIAVLGLTLALAPGTATAGKRGGTFSPAVAKRLVEAQELMQADKPAQALKSLNALTTRRGLKPAELATLYMLAGYAANQLDDTKEAIDFFTKSIKERALPISQELGLEYAVAQLYMMLGDFELGLRILRGWFKKTAHKDSPVKPNGANYYTLALCYINLERVEKARRPAELAVASTPNPQESWLQLLAQIYYLTKDYENLAATVTRLIEGWPKPAYYKQLSGAYAEAGEDLKSLAVLQLAYQQGILTTDKEVRHLARTYLFHEIPYQAAQVLEKGLRDELLEPDMQTLMLLADAWQLSRDTKNALAPLDQAAEIAEDGDVYLRLGRSLISEEMWEEADSAFTSALEKGIEDDGPAHLLQGLARMNLRRWTAARASFNAAARFESQEKYAESYKVFLKVRREQYEALRS